MRRYGVAFLLGLLGYLAAAGATTLYHDWAFVHAVRLGAEYRAAHPTPAPPATK